MKVKNVKSKKVAKEAICLFHGGETYQGVRKSKNVSDFDRGYYF
jgi:hypothetical protein